MATECRTRSGFSFQPKLVLDFAGGEITSEAGLVVLREFDERLRLTHGLRAAVPDERDARYVTHELVTLLRQRLYQIAAGYEDATMRRTCATIRRSRRSCTASASRSPRSRRSVASSTPPRGRRSIGSDA